MDIRTEPVKKADATDRHPISIQMDELERLSIEARDKFLGTGHFDNITSLYNIEEAKESSPSFRPRVIVPQLQMLGLSEATDLSDADPKIYVLNHKKGERDKEREDCFMAQWRQGYWNNQIMLANLWAWFSGIGYIQVGHDPTARGGRGAVWAKARDPKTVYHDPSADNDRDGAYMMWDDWMYVDQVRQKWPEQGFKVKPRHQARAVTPDGTLGYGFQLPPGPMSAGGGLGTGGSSLMSDGRVRVRYLQCRDASVEEIEEKGLPTDSILVRPRFRPKYPNGRLIIECEGVILFDGDNPTPCGHYNLIRFLGLPALGGYFGPPPTRYSESLQKLSERMFTQLFENAVRLNNGIVVISEQSGIQLDNFGGIPAEVHVVSGPASEAINITYPNAMPQHMIELPKFLLDLQRNLQGFTPARMGEASAGNVSSGLYDMGVYQSQKLTRMRGRLMAESVHRMAELAFLFMTKFYKQTYFPGFKENAQGDSEPYNYKWEDVTNGWGDYELQLDPASIRPISGAAMRMIVPMLRQLGMLDTLSALEMMDVPNANEIAQRLKNEGILQALQSLKRK
jgi:hypothetical protein